MNYKFLIIIDKLLRPFYVLFNALKCGKTKPLHNQKFIVLKFFGIGSITRIAHVMDTTGIAKNHVTFITLYKNKAIIDLLNLNAIYIKTRDPIIFFSSLFQTIFKTWNRKQTTILDMERKSYASGIFRLIIGIRKLCNSFHFKFENSTKNGQYFVSLVNKPTTEAIAELFHKRYTYPKGIKNKKVSSDKIFININAGNYCPERKFTLAQYATLIKNLHKKNPNWRFYLTGLKSEFNYVESFKNRLLSLKISSESISNIAGLHNLPEFVEQLKNVKLFITNDSGPLHLAHLFKVKTVGVWGPTSSRLIGYPNSEYMLNLESDVACSPCFIHPKSKTAKYCGGDLTCFKSIDTEQMATRIHRFTESYSI